MCHQLGSTVGGGRRLLHRLAPLLPGNTSLLCRVLELLCFPGVPPSFPLLSTLAQRSPSPRTRQVPSISLLDMYFWVKAQQNQFEKTTQESSHSALAKVP